MLNIWLYSIISVIIISILSLIGIIFFSIREKLLKDILIYAISISTGALFGDAFIHLLPEAVKKNGFTIEISLFLISGIVFSFIIEKILHWRHCHHQTTKTHPHPLSTMNLFGEGVHNFIDGLIIAASYIASIPIGIATTIAVIFHEGPHELGNFSILVYAGIKKERALLYNFLISMTAILGAVIGLLISSQSESILNFLIPFAAGNFIYIAGSDLIPEIHKDSEKISKAILQLIMFLLGIGIMYVLLILG